MPDASETKAGEKAGRKRGTAGGKVLSEVAYEQLKGKTSAPKVRVSQVEPVRRIVEEELESVWANRKPAKEALDHAVQRGNAALTTFLAKAKTGR